MIDTSDSLGQILSIFAAGNVAELEIEIDIPEQTFRVTLRRDPFMPRGPEAPVER